MSAALLSINVGSSSLKFALYDARVLPSHDTLVCHGAVAGIGTKSRFTVQDGANRAIVDRNTMFETHAVAIKVALDVLDSDFADRTVAGVGHRIVHGGPRYRNPVLVDATVVNELRQLIPMAPLHQPTALDVIDLVEERYPNVPQIACFDTAFHATMPPAASDFALSRTLRERNVRRYGFHGLSYEYIAGELARVCGSKIASGRVIIAHLGSGASICALADGKSTATTMGMTPLDGLPMGRRSGSIDPGVLLYLLQEKIVSTDELSHLLYSESGLLGLSEISDDIQVLLASSDRRAQETIDYFAYWVNRHLGSLVAALGGLDALVFTGGVGENLPEIRRRICENAAWLGFKIDERANATGSPRISTAIASPSAWVIPTNETLVVARQTFRTLASGEIDPPKP